MFMKFTLLTVGSTREALRSPSCSINKDEQALIILVLRHRRDTALHQHDTRNQAIKIYDCYSLGGGRNSFTHTK